MQPQRMLVIVKSHKTFQINRMEVRGLEAADTRNITIQFSNFAGNKFT